MFVGFLALAVIFFGFTFDSFAGFGSGGIGGCKTTESSSHLAIKFG